MRSLHSLAINRIEPPNSALPAGPRIRAPATRLRRTRPAVGTAAPSLARAGAATGISILAAGLFATERLSLVKETTSLS